jgi:hypothetical protein
VGGGGWGGGEAPPAGVRWRQRPLKEDNTCQIEWLVDTTG